MIRSTVCCSAMILVLAATAAAQDPAGDPGKETNPASIVPFLEGTEVHFTNDGNIVFEASIAPHLVFFQNYGRSLVVEEPGPRRFLGGSWLFRNSAFTGTPGVNLRMFRETSKPVRTPSFTPRIQYQKLFVDLDKQRAALQRKERQLDDTTLKEVHVSFVHYSNGQKGCSILGQTRLPADDGTPDEGECEPAALTGRLNTKDGSFSTNYVRVGANWRRTNLETEGLQEESAVAAYSTWEYGVRADLDLHVQRSEAIRDDFPSYRVRGTVEGAKSKVGLCRKRAHVAGAVIYSPETPDDISRFAYAVTGSCFITRRGGWGLLARYYHGQDYYNIRYRETLKRFQFGIVYSQDGFLRLFKNGTAPAE